MRRQNKMQVIGEYGMPVKFPTITEDEMRRRLEPPEGKIRLIIDTDTHNEIDDQYALAWALLSQDQLEIEGVLAEPYSHRHHRQPRITRNDGHACQRTADCLDWRLFNLLHLAGSIFSKFFVKKDRGFNQST